MSRVPRIRFKGFEEDWEQRKLGEMVEFYNGDRSSRYPNDSDMVFDGIPFINAGDLVLGRVKLDTTNKITEEKYNQLSGAKIQCGDIIYCLRGTLGKNAFVDNFDIGTIASSLVDIRPQKIVGKYLFQVLNSDIEYSQRILNDEGAAQPNLSAKNLYLFDIPIPRDAEQIKIAEYLELLDHLITLHRSKSFGYILKEIVNCTLSWEQRKLGEIAERIIRKNEKLESTLPLTISAQYGLIDQNEFFDKRIASKDVRGYYLIKKGEFAYNKSTSVDAPFGAIKRLDKYNNGVLSTLYILFKIIDDTSTGSDYLVTYYATDLWHRGIQSIAAEGARNHGLLNIAPNDFFETMLSIPLNISEQKKVGDFFISLDHLITLHQLEPYKLIFKAIAYRIIDYAKSKPLSSIK